MKRDELTGNICWEVVHVRLQRKSGYFERNACLVTCFYKFTFQISNSYYTLQKYVLWYRNMFLSFLLLFFFSFLQSYKSTYFSPLKSCRFTTPLWNNSLWFNNPYGKQCVQFPHLLRFYKCIQKLLSIVYTYSINPLNYNWIRAKI